MLRYKIALGISIGFLILSGSQMGMSEPTLPIMPKTNEAPLLPRVTLPEVQLPADVPNQPLTATEAAMIALRRQPSILAARAGIEASQGRLQQSKSGLRPTLVLSSSYNNSSGATSNNSDGFNASATVRQLLFDYNRTRSQVRQSQMLERSATANLSRAQSDLVLQVKQAFYGYLQSERLVSVNEANLRNRQSQVDLAKARLNAGLGLPSDVVRAETASANAVFSLNLAQNTASVARVLLAQLMGLDARTPIQVSEDQEAPPPTDDFNTLVDMAQRQRPEIIQTQANLDASQYGVNVAKTTNLPSVVGSVGIGSRGNHFPPDGNSTAFGILLQWSAFDSGLTAGRVKEARANVLTAQSQIESARLTVTTDVSQAYLNAKTAEQRVATAVAEVANAEEGVRLAQGRYASGLGVFLDVLDAQTALVTAQTNLVNAQSAVNQARAALARAVYSDPVATSVK